MAVPDLGSEQTALPELLKVLDLAGAVVTLDVAGCHAVVAEKIKVGGGEYVLALKDNQPLLRQAVADRFLAVVEGGPPGTTGTRKPRPGTGGRTPGPAR